MARDSRDAGPDSALEKLFHHPRQVRLVYWRTVSGAKSAVLLTAFTAVISFVSGLSLLSESEAILAGPLVSIAPGLAEFVKFVGVLFAFLLAGVAFGLDRGKRLAWYLAIVLLPLLGLVPLATLRSTEAPLFILGFGTLAVVLVNRGHFDQSLDLSPIQIAALSSIVGVVLYGAVGAYVLSDQFGALDSFGDAIYYVIVTIATVGYGDITPLTSEAKWFSLSVILLGTGAFTAAIGSVLIPAIEERMASAVGTMKPKRINLLEDHVLVLGYSDLTASLVESLEGERDLVVVTEKQSDAANLDEMDVPVLTGDPTDEETLEEARIGDSSGVVVGVPEDPTGLMAIVAVRNVAPDVRIVAAAKDHGNVEKFRSVGADEVISPASVGGRLLGQAVLADVSPHSILAEEPGGPADSTNEGEATDE